jgi:hypothetical protein
VIAFPALSRVIAVARVVCPTRKADAASDTVTLATGTGTTTSVACALSPEADAMMLVVPTPTALTTPDAATVATALLDDVHVT